MTGETSRETAGRNAPRHSLSAGFKRADAGEEPQRSTAAIIVRDFDGMAVHTLLNIQRLFPNHFHNVIFISVGVVDTGQFKGRAEIENLKRQKEEDLKSFVDFATCLGWYAEYRFDLGVDLIDELNSCVSRLPKSFRVAIFFSANWCSRKKMFLPACFITTRRIPCSRNCNSAAGT